MPPRGPRAIQKPKNAKGTLTRLLGYLKSHRVRLILVSVCILCSTLISTNCDIDELAEQYSPQVASRLVGCFKILFFTGPDIRLVKKLR